MKELRDAGSNARLRAIPVGIAALLTLVACGGSDSDNAEGEGDGPTTATAADTSNEQLGQTGPITEGGKITVRGCKPRAPSFRRIPRRSAAATFSTRSPRSSSVTSPRRRRRRSTSPSPSPARTTATYTIKLKRDIKFHDGTEVTADSFVDAWNFGAYGPNAQQAASFFDPIEGYDDVHPADPDGEEGKKEAPEPSKKTMSGLKKVSDTEFTVKLTAENSTFPQRLGYTAFAPLPESFFKDDGKAFGKKPIGAGPFKMVSFDANKEAVLEKDADYDRAGKPHIDGVTFKIFNKADAAYAEVVSNQLDLTDEIPSANLVDEIFKKDLSDRFASRAQGVIQTITFPPSKTDSSYDNPKLRQAISMSIDRAAVIKLAFPERKPAQGWVSPVAGGFKAGACGDYCLFNKDRAKQLFDEAGGYDGTMTIGYNADSTHNVWAEAVCNNIKQNLGVECLAKPSVDFATFRTAIDNREMKGMFRTGWQMDYPSIENFLDPIFKTGASSNDGDYSNKEFDRLLDAARAEKDPEEVFKKYQDAEALLARDMPAIPLWYPTSIHAHSDKVTNVKITAFGTYDFSSITVK